MDSSMDEPSNWSDKLLALLELVFDSKYDLKPDRDDTLFERFVSTLDNQLKDNNDYANSLLRNKKFCEYTQKFFNSDSLNPKQLMPALRVLSIVVCNGRFDDFLTYHSAVALWFRSCFNNTNQNADAMYTSLFALEKMVHVQGCIEWMLNYGGVTYIIQGLSHSSLHTRRKSKDIMKLLIVNALNNLPHLNNIILKIVKEILALVKQNPKESNTILVLIETCQASDNASRMLVEDLNCISSLSEIINKVDCLYAESNLGMLCAVLVSFKADSAVAMKTCISFIAHEKYQAAIIFACEALIQHPHFSDFMDVVITPISGIIKTQNLHSRFDITAVDVIKAKRIVSSSVQCLSKLCCIEKSPLKFNHYKIVTMFLKVLFSENAPSIVKGDKLKLMCLDLCHKYHSKKLLFDVGTIDDIFSIWIEFSYICSTNCPLLIDAIKWLAYLLYEAGETLETCETKIEIESLLSWYLMDVKWEVQDSIVELLIFLLASEKSYFGKWIIQKRYHVTLHDIYVQNRANAYVISSCLKAFQALFNNDYSKEAIATDLNLTPDLFISEIVTIFDENPEFNVRRTASEILAAHHPKELNTSWRDSTIFSIMTVICHYDLDWTVKLNAVSFWKKILSEILTLDATEMEKLKILEINGFISSIISCFKDYEITVKQEVCAILQHIKSSFKIDDMHKCSSANGANNTNNSLSVSSVENPVFTTSERDKGIEEVVDINEYDRIYGLLRPEDYKKKSESIFKMDKVFCHSVKDLYELLSSTDFIKCAAEFEKRSETYKHNFASLISDLVECLVVMPNDDSISLDCY